MTHNPNSKIISSLFNSQATMSSLMAQSNNLAKLTGEACLIGEKLQNALFVCNSEIMVTAFSQIVKGINPHVNTAQTSLCDFIKNTNTNNNNDIIVLILSDSADINKVSALDLSHATSAKVFVVAPQSFQLPKLHKLGANVSLALESTAEQIRDAFLRGLQGEQFELGFPQSFDESFNEKYAALTQRQRQVLKLMIQGKSNKEIARELDNEVSTIKVHCTAIFKFLGVTSRIQVAAVV